MERSQILSAMGELKLHGMKAAYGLSRAETRMLERVMQGASLAEAASALCISQNTAKSHLSQLFAKTGAKRQASLVALVNRLVPPIAP